VLHAVVEVLAGEGLARAEAALEVLRKDRRARVVGLEVGPVGEELEAHFGAAEAELPAAQARQLGAREAPVTLLGPRRPRRVGRLVGPRVARAATERLLVLLRVGLAQLAPAAFHAIARELGQRALGGALLDGLVQRHQAQRERQRGQRQRQRQARAQSHAALPGARR